MKILDPKNLHDAKTLIDKTVNGAPKAGIAGGIAGKVEDVQKAIDNFNNLIDAISHVGGFIKTFITDPMAIFYKVQGIAPDFILILLGILIILRFLGFETTNKYILLTLVIAFIIAII